jgi:hypothetical protein
MLFFLFSDFFEDTPHLQIKKALNSQDRIKIYCVSCNEIKIAPSD